MEFNMELDTRSGAILRRVIYPIQFEADPVNGIDRVIRLVVMRSPEEIPPGDYLQAIHAGLASEDKLSELIPQSHSETVIRAFLAALRTRLESELSK
jgi:hypothetical protein